VPFARSVVSIPAGTSRMTLLRFTVLTTIGSAVWNAVLIGAGYALGANWDRVSGWVGAYSDVVLVVVAAILYPLIRHFLGRKREG
jgi:membrane protein DedA with SNARE-associated domain